MKRILILILAGAFLISACGASGDIEVHNAWVRPSAQGENAAVYLQLQNHTNSADELTGASSDLADAVEIHESMMSNDVMQMDMVPSITLGANEDVTLSPGGYHIMLVGIQQEIKAGDSIEIVLHFKNHADIVVSATAGDAPADEHQGEHK